MARIPGPHNSHAVHGFGCDETELNDGAIDAWAICPGSLSEFSDLFFGLGNGVVDPLGGLVPINSWGNRFELTQKL